MRRVVLDASVLLGWFTRHGPPQPEARALRAEYDAGTLMVVVPPILFADVLETLSRATGWPASKLARLAQDLEALGFEVRTPAGSELARWIGLGLTGSEAAYAAVASELDLPLATTDERLLRIASPVTRR